MKRVGRLLVALLGRARDACPVTACGALVAAGSAVAVGIYGLGRLDLILLALGGVGLGVVALGVLLVLTGALVVWLRVRRAAADPRRLECECGFFSGTGFCAPRLRWLPLVEVRWSWDAPRPEVRAVPRKGQLLEEIRPGERALFEAIVRRFEIRDVLGFAGVRFRAVERRAGRFAPWMGALRQMHVVHGLAGGSDLSHPEGPPQGDLYDARRYAAGDPIRFILWKVFARTRALLVRAPERALSQERRTVAYLVAGEGAEPAAGAARVAVDGGALGVTWVLGADGTAETAASRDGAIDLLARSAGATPAETGALGAFLQRVGRSAGTRAVVFVPPRPGPWMSRVLAAARAAPGSRPGIDFVVCTDGIAPGAPRSALARVALGAGAGAGRDAAPGPAPASAREVAEVVGALGSTGANVLVVDRPAGRLFSGRGLTAAALGAPPSPARARA